MLLHEPKWRRLLRFWRSDVAADVDDELRFHFEARAEEIRARGLTREEIDRTIAEEFGDVEATRVALREIDGRIERRRERLQWLQHRRADLAYAWRGLRATPGFTLGVVVTLALGVGAVTLMYGRANQLLLEPPPHVAAHEHVWRLFNAVHAVPDTAPVRSFQSTSYPYFERVRDHARTLAGVAGYMVDGDLAVGRGADARKVNAVYVSDGFWRTLGTRPYLGRFVTDDEAHPVTGARVVVLDYGFWKRRYGSDPSVLGTTLQVKGQPYRIVGIAPRGFRGVELVGADVWLPLFAYGDGEKRVTWHTFASNSMIGLAVRPRLGVTNAVVERELAGLREQLLEEDEHDRGPRRYRVDMRLVPLTGGYGSTGNRLTEATITIWLVGVAVVLLLIACANVATLLLLRAMRRRREIAVRLALGMTRRRLAALLLVESALLAALGGGVSWIVVVWGNAWIQRMLMPGVSVELAEVVSWPMLAVALACLALTALVTGMVPVLQTRQDVATSLRDGAQHGATARSRLYHGLLIAQTALSALLLVGAGLFVRSLDRVASLDLGLETERTMVVRIDFTGLRNGRETIAFFERALERARSVPGVERASLAMSPPLGTAHAGSFYMRPGDCLPVLKADRSAPHVNYVAEDFFESTGMRLLAGRTFVASDRGGAPVVIVSEAMAKHAWPGRSPIGECVYEDNEKPACTRVVGVVHDARTFFLREQPGEHLWFYEPLNPGVVNPRTLIVRAAPGARHLDATLRRALRELDPTLPYIDVKTLGDHLDPQMRPWRLGAAVFTAFGLLAAILAAIGLYTAVAYAVTQRTREIGVRIALGALGGAIVRMVLGDGVRIAAAGVALGLLLALAAGRWIADLLFDTSPRDPLVIGGVALVLLAVAVVASLAPARRAVRVNPMQALRAD